jgi:Tfp pilus assembly pilus retraction ATPase PilT
MQTGSGAGMQSLDSALKKLVEDLMISGEEAYAHAVDKSLFERYAVRREMA